MKGIEHQIQELILQHGSISIDEFVALVLSASNTSYYKNTIPIGLSGDFITAPEISQMFGETLSLWIMERWQHSFNFEPFNLIELGPGRGTLMFDIIRSLKHVPNFLESINIYLLEINPALIKLQQESLAPFNLNIHWVSTSLELPKFNSIIIANEFLDCLGPKQFIKLDDNWHERKITTTESSDLIFSSMKLKDENLLRRLRQYNNTAEGAIIEINFEAENYLHNILDHFSNYKFAGLFIDYGYYQNPKLREENSYKCSLQAIKSHKFHNIFKDLGIADITSHIDFYPLEQIATNQNFTSSTITQRQFLHDFAIKLRLDHLKRQNPSKAIALDGQYNYLTADDKMGSLFKILQIF
jgi:SAM-dependent MidA family methyltransferase